MNKLLYMPRVRPLVYAYLLLCLLLCVQRTNGGGALMPPPNNPPNNPRNGPMNDLNALSQHSLQLFIDQSGQTRTETRTQTQTQTQPVRPGEGRTGGTGETRQGRGLKDYSLTLRDPAGHVFAFSPATAPASAAAGGGGGGSGVGGGVGSSASYYSVYGDGAGVYSFQCTSLAAAGESASHSLSGSMGSGKVSGSIYHICLYIVYT
jgi:hypothetical protein